jgi:hypothetical protein
VEGHYVEGRFVARTFCSEGRFVEGRFVLAPLISYASIVYFAYQLDSVFLSLFSQIFQLKEPTYTPNRMVSFQS